MYLDIYDAGDQTLDDTVESFVEKNEGFEFSVTTRTEINVGGEKATQLEYRFGNLNRYGSATFFKHDNMIYGLVFNATVFCELLAEDTVSGMSELGTYLRILESLQFDR